MEKLQSHHKSLLTPHNLSPTHVPVLNMEEVPRIEELSAGYAWGQNSPASQGWQEQNQKFLEEES